MADRGAGGPELEAGLALIRLAARVHENASFLKGLASLRRVGPAASSVIADTMEGDVASDLRDLWIAASGLVDGRVHEVSSLLDDLVGLKLARQAELALWG